MIQTLINRTRLDSVIFKSVGAYNNDNNNTSIPNKLVKIKMHNRNNSVSCENGMHLNNWHFDQDVVTIIFTQGQLQHDGIRLRA